MVEENATHRMASHVINVFLRMEKENTTDRMARHVSHFFYADGSGKGFK